MQKKSSRQLILKKTTLANLTNDDLRNVAGGLRPRDLTVPLQTDGCDSGRAY